MYIKENVQQVIEWLYSIEPKCNHCDHCQYGWTTNPKIRQLCYNEQEKVSIEHEKWKQKLNKWMDRLKYAE